MTLDTSPAARHRRLQTARRILRENQHKGGQGISPWHLTGSPEDRQRALIILAADVLKIENRPVLQMVPLATDDERRAA
jgi:hypothetical protein